MSNKAYYFGDANAIARLMKKMYFGVETEVPVYEEREVTTTKQLSVANLGDFFTVTNGAGNAGWTVSDVSTGKIKLNPNNIGVNNSTATITLKATHAFTMVRFDGTSWVTEANYDKLSVVLYKSNGVLDVRYANEASGTSALGSGHGKSMESGGYITLTYVKDSSGHATNESVTVAIECQDSITITTTEQVQVGTANKELARKVIRAYQPDANGKAQLWFDADAAGDVVFTGEHTVQDVTVDGAARKLYTLTGDGVLTVSKAVSFFMIGGGSSGEMGFIETSGSEVMYSGSGGSSGFVAQGTLDIGIWQVHIGVGGRFAISNPTGGSHIAGGATTITQGATSFSAAGGSISEYTDQVSGGSGGGSRSGVATDGAYTGIKHKGAGVSTVPFGLSDILGIPGAGGASGYVESGPASRTGRGCNGGSNGSDGRQSSSSIPAIGGADGGGNGGGNSEATANGGDATTPGSGGGGGSMILKYASSPLISGKGGAGADGAVWLLV